MRRSPTLLPKTLVACCGLLLAACAAVDQFGGRIEDANTNTQRAVDQETLLNIVRAKYYRPLTFIGISQVTGGQTESLTTGLPTVTFGSGYTPAQHIGQITNSVQSQATGGYQSNPLVSTAFQTGMLASINEATVAYLLSAHPRDAVFFSTVQAIVVRPLDGKLKGIYRFENNPDLDNVGRRPDLDCPAAVAAALNSKVNPNLEVFKLARDCSYSAFLPMLQLTIQKGLTSQLVDTSTEKKPQPGGRFCFDLSLSGQGGQSPACATPGKPVTSKTPKVPLQYYLEGIGHVQVSIYMKSPLGVYMLLGALLRNPASNRTLYATRAGGLIVPDGAPFLEVTEALGPCFVSVNYEGNRYCVPSEAKNTPILFHIVQQLKNLSITPADLNAPFAVRFIGN